MPPTTRSRGQVGVTQSDDGPGCESHRDEVSDDEVSDASMEEEDDDDDDAMVIRSHATNISYDISSLDPETQAGVRELFRIPPDEETPQLILQWCQSVQEQQDGQFYAFQMHEVVRKSRAVRIGSARSRYPKPRCNCMRDSDKPCKHLIFLLDRLNHQTSDHLLPDVPVDLGADGDWTGSSSSSSNPYESISNYHLDLLASNLHCDVGSPDSRPAVNPVRLQETREILVSIEEPGIDDDYAVKEYRPDIFEDPAATFDDNDLIAYNDLTRTVANMLMTNNEFFSHFLRLLGPDSRAGNPFRRIQQHVDRVLGELEAYARGGGGGSSSSSPPAETTATTTRMDPAAEGPRDVPWAAAHITRAVSAIQSLLQDRKDAPSSRERAAAARALVRILRAVVCDWNRDVRFVVPAAIAQTANADTANTTTSTTTAKATSNSSSSSSSSKASPPRTDPPRRPPPQQQKQIQPGQTQQPQQQPQQQQPQATAPQLIDRNLYHRLIGSQTRTSSAFAVDVLAQLPEQNQWIETLEEIESQLGAYGPPAGYVRRLRDVIALMRSSRPPRPQPQPPAAAPRQPPPPSPAAALGAGVPGAPGRTAGKRRRGGGSGSWGGAGGGREGGAKRAAR
ncbi:hypothetical protein SLS53_003234 [Cytospora paraplurivora]|uniref:SWIM-type domain-containing protein n=1 Tax=Cytospora paraplurivora TaxID=2898453 RepID=A0AAN9UER2_9PEZI